MKLPQLHPLAYFFSTFIIASPASFSADKEHTVDALLSEIANTKQISETAAQPQVIKIADKVVTGTALMPGASFNQEKSHTIQESGASFIKIHFSAFNLPKNSQVVVSSPDGKEVYRYGNQKRDGFTFDPKNGEDGKQAWASMSINGDTALVKIIIDPKHPWQDGLHQLKIGHYWKGYSEDTIEGLIQTRSTCGKMQRKDAMCYKDSHPTEYAHTKPVARLVMNGGLCTAWRVGADNRMFTNNHCMSTQSKVSSSEVWFNYQMSQCGGGQKTKTVKVSGDKMLKTSRSSSSSLDYTLFTVKDFSSIKSFSYLGLAVREPKQNEDIYIAQHGAGKPKELSIEDDQNQRNRCQVDKPTSSKSNLGYKCDTTGGSSGSPVLVNNGHKVIGLHHWGGCPSGTNSAAKIKDIWPEVAEFFNNKIPADGVGGGSNPDPDPNPNPNPNPNPTPDDKFKPLANKLNACLGVGSNAKVNASSCQNSKSQQWELDTKGLLHPASDPKKCLQMPQWWKGSNRAVIGSCDSKQLHQRWQLKQGRIENLAYPMIYLKHFKAYGDWVGVWTKDNSEGEMWQWK